MKQTDYSRIASSYDQADERHDISADTHLGARLASQPGPFRVLDLACGTGNYLRVQRALFPDPRIAWHGIDASVDMLGRACDKLDGVTLQLGQADALPFEDGHFHYLACNFAFHHFPDKRAALREMSRVLAPEGGLRLANVAPERMPAWWVFRFFPEARLHDSERFWSAELLQRELELVGFRADVAIRVTLRREPASVLLERARRRDMSSVAIVSDEAYAAGIALLETASARGERVAYDEALLTCEALRTSG